MTRYNTREQQRLIDDTREKIRVRTAKRVNRELMEDWIAGKISLEDHLAMIQKQV